MNSAVQTSGTMPVNSGTQYPVTPYPSMGNAAYGQTAASTPAQGGYAMQPSTTAASNPYATPAQTPSYTASQPYGAAAAGQYGAQPSTVTR